LGVALRSFGVLRTPQDDKLGIWQTDDKAATVVDGDCPGTATTGDQLQQRVILSGAKDLSGGPPHVQSAELSFALAAATASIHQ
jgi:hypothetical protein